MIYRFCILKLFYLIGIMSNLQIRWSPQAFFVHLEKLVLKCTEKLEY